MSNLSKHLIDAEGVEIQAAALESEAASLLQMLQKKDAQFSEAELEEDDEYFFGAIRYAQLTGKFHQ